MHAPGSPLAIPLEVGFLAISWNLGACVIRASSWESLVYMGELLGDRTLVGIDAMIPTNGADPIWGG